MLTKEIRHILEVIATTDSYQREPTERETILYLYRLARSKGKTALESILWAKLGYIPKVLVSLTPFGTVATVHPWTAICIKHAVIPINEYDCQLYGVEPIDDLTIPQRQKPLKWGICSKEQ